MKLLLVDNGSIFLRLLQEALKEHEVVTERFDHLLSRDGFDAVVLSGGSQVSWKEAPIAFKKELVRLPGQKKGVEEVKKVLDDPLLEGLDRFQVFESHKLRLMKARYLMQGPRVRQV
ncbi:MAG TPA: hypothetical protein VJG90_02930 [Candidatus Nanoarchaeia archaeon]|nr:hypothetical protein [Candidatus Nanoarchaeia archaeon]